jgi:hypothetical protein
MGANKKRKTSSPRNYFAIILPFIALMIVPFGCAHRPEVKAPPLPKFTEAELGRIAVVSACFEPKFSAHKPMTSEKAAGVGALEGFRASIQGGGTSGNALGIPLGIALSPVFAVAGAIYGATAGETEKTIKETEEILNHCFNALRAQEVMQERVLSLARDRTRNTFVEPDQRGPNVPDEETRYDSLNGKGIDTVLEISVRDFYLILWGNKGGINPPLSLFMTASIRLIRVQDDAVLFSRKFMYVSKEKHKFTKWAKNDGQLFKEELDRCFKSLGERIVAELFII